MSSITRVLGAPEDVEVLEDDDEELDDEDEVDEEEKDVVEEEDDDVVDGVEVVEDPVLADDVVEGALVAVVTEACMTYNPATATIAIITMTATTITTLPTARFDINSNFRTGVQNIFNLSKKS